MIVVNKRFFVDEKKGSQIYDFLFLFFYCTPTASKGISEDTVKIQ